MEHNVNEDNRQALADIQRWFDSPLGQQVLETEQAILEQLLGTLFGYNLLQVSVQQRELFSSSPIQTKVALGLNEGGAGQLICRPDRLPFENDTIDVALVHHTLDFVDQPQELLRELARVVLPMGHVVLIGFNPLSLWGLWKMLASFSGAPPWNGSFILPDRLMDWMNLLNFRIDRTHYGHHGLPLARRQRRRPDFSLGLSRQANLPVGGVYVIVARKHVGRLIPVKPLWRSQQQGFGQLSVVRSASREALSGEGFDSPAKDR